MYGVEHEVPAVNVSHLGSSNGAIFGLGLSVCICVSGYMDPKP